MTGAPGVAAAAQPQVIALEATARLAWNADLASVLVRAVSSMRPLEAAEEIRVTTAVHEALANALLHGSLELDSFDRRQPSALAAYGELVAQRLDDPCYGGRTIRLRAQLQDRRLEVTIEDEGPGFAAHLDRPFRPGRGLALIERLCQGMAFSRDGARLQLVFTLAERASPGAGCPDGRRPA